MGDIQRVDSEARWPLRVRAAVVAVSLSLLFVVVYGSTNWFTALRSSSQVGTWLFSWETAVIPYVPLLIVPYMSIDLFFFLAAFLCRDRRELQIFASRVAFTILVAAAFFLLMPLRLAWPARPPVEGWFGEFVELSCTAPFLMEYPHNLFPCLHVALCLLLADIYGRRTRGLIRALLYVWFTLICLSTVLLWQHHLVDIAGGLVLAAFAFYLFREQEHLPVVPNYRVGTYYAIGALAVLAAAPIVWPWGVFLLWPAAALAIVAAAYFGLGPGIYGKTDGRLPLSTRVVLSPILIGQYLSLVYYRRQCRAWDEVTPHVLVGRILNDSEALQVIREGVVAVLDLTAEFSAAAPFRTINYLNVPILDLTRPTNEQLRLATTFISEQSAHGKVYIHCKIGYSRSVAVTGAYLIATHQAANSDEAIARLRRVRPTIVIRPEILQALQSN